MRDWSKPYCRICERPVEECGSLSTRGKCADCRKQITDFWCDSLHYHQNPGLIEWRRGVAASVGAVLVDDIIREL
jgi:hypothetical protein